MITLGLTNKTNLLVKHLNAIDGIDRLQAVKSYHSKGTLNGFKYENRIVLSKSNIVIVENENYYAKTSFSSGEIKVTLGDSSFINTNQEIINDYEIQSWIFPLAYSSNLIIKIEDVSSSVSNNKLHTILLITFKNGVTWKIYINKETNLIDQNNTSAGMKIAYNKYKTINDIIFPVEMKIEIDGKVQAELKLETIKIL